MTLNRYYHEELIYLRELSKEFAREHPGLAPALLEAGADPDVERVLEGTAFLTGALRQKLDDDLPELTQTMLQMLWPHYLRPVPSTTIVEFYHPQKPKVTATEILRAGEVELESVPVDRTPCLFRTCYDVAFQPLAVTEARLETGGRGGLRIRFAILADADPAELQLEPLRLHLHGDMSDMTEVRYWLLRHTESVVVEAGPERRPRRHKLRSNPPPISEVGFVPDEGLFPYPKHSFLGYRLLQEYFTLPHKFNFIDVHGLSALASLEPEGTFDLVFHFGERLPEGTRISTENFRLHCTPAVNLMKRDADPIRLDHRHSNYLVRPSDPEPNHFEVYSVDRVTGLSAGLSRRQEYLPFYAFRHGMEPGDAKAVYYKLRRSQSVGKPNSDCHLSFVSAEELGQLPPAESVSIELTCTNRRIAEALQPGDVSRHTDQSPQFAEFHNITKPTTSAIPPLGGGFHWRLISHLSLNMASLSDAQSLRGLLSLYDFPALHDVQAARQTQHRIESIQQLESHPAQRIYRGAVMRGVATQIALTEDRFGSEGELFLFASVLNEFLSLYVTVNAFSQLTIRGAQKGEIYEWPPRVGTQFTL